MKGIAVTGAGIISSLGDNLKENYSSLRSGKDGLDYPKILETNHKLLVGEIEKKDSELAESLQIPEDHNFTRAALLGVQAVSDLLLNCDLREFPSETGFISGTSVGGIDATERYYREYSRNSAHRKFIQAQHPGFTTGKIAEYFGINSFVTTISTACSSSANAIMMGARLIEAGKLKRVIVGGSDCLTKFTLNGFNSLMILSSKKNRPFDEHRDGLNLGEAAGYILLEADDLIGDKPVLGRITGYGNANDAYHQTASSENGEGAFLAMSKALQKAGISSENIDYINAHGTGTQNNDLSESRALMRIFGENMPPFSSSKGFTGHTLGAAGAVEAIFSLLSLREQLIFPNLNFEIAMAETGLIPVSEINRAPLNTVISNSFGFGGNCTSLIFSKDE